jgi:hypothetical protein
MFRNVARLRYTLLCVCYAEAWCAQICLVTLQLLVIYEHITKCNLFRHSCHFAYLNLKPHDSRFFTPVQNGLGADPASYTVGTGILQGVKRPGRGVDHPPHLTLRLKKE